MAQGVNGGGGGSGNEIEIVGTAESETILETNFPAASNEDKWAIIKGTIPQDSDGMYKSDGVLWVKQLDDSDFRIGTRSQLFDFTTGLSYGPTNDLRFTAGTFITSHDANSNAAQLFDGSVLGTGVSQIFHSGNWPNYMGKIFSGSTKLALGRFRINNRVNQFNQNGIQTKQIIVQGQDDFGVWHNIPYGNIVEDAGGKAVGEPDGFTITYSTQPTETEWLVLETTNTTGYRGYRICNLSNFGDPFYNSMAEFEGYVSIDQSDSINPVNSINKLHQIVKDFGEWVEDPGDLGKSLYDYQANAIVKFGPNLYRNFSGGIIPKGSDFPNIDTVNWVIHESIEIVAESENPTDLETNFPAANNSNKWAIVQGTLPQDEDGLYRSDGISWVKKLDDADFKVGTRSNLWDFSSGLSYGLSNDIRFTPSSNHAFNGGFQAAPIFDGDVSASGVANFSHGGDFGQASCGRIFTSAKLALGRFRINNRVDASNNTGHQTRQLKIQGRNDVGAWIDIPYGNISDDAGGKVTGEPDLVTLTYSSQPSETEWLQVDTNNITGYTGYRLRLLDNFGSPFDNTIAEFEGYASIDLSSTINTVNSINKLHQIVKDFGEWVEDTANPGTSIYGYSANAIVKFGPSLYRNTSGGIVAAGSNDPSVDTANWTLIL